MQTAPIVGQIKNVNIIVDDIMIVGKKTSHSDHDQALNTLVDTGRRCNVCLNYDKLQYNKLKVDFFGETYTTSDHKPAQSKVSAITASQLQPARSKSKSCIGMINYLSKFSA